MRDNYPTQQSTPGLLAGEAGEDDHLDRYLHSALQAWLATLKPSLETQALTRRRLGGGTPFPDGSEEPEMYPFNDQLIYLLQKEHHEHLLQEAEQNRLIRMVRLAKQREAHGARQDGHGARPPFYCYLLSWLGGQLVVLGTALLERYGSTPGEFTTSTAR